MGRPAREPAGAGPAAGQATPTWRPRWRRWPNPLLGLVQEAPDRPPRPLPDAHVFHRRAANRPRVSHALRYAREMRRWGQTDRELSRAEAAEVFRTDLYRAALEPGD